MLLLQFISTCFSMYLIITFCCCCDSYFYLLMVRNFRSYYDIQTIACESYAKNYRISDEELYYMSDEEYDEMCVFAKKRYYVYSVFHIFILALMVIIIY